MSSKSTSNSRCTTCYFVNSWKTKENFSSWYTIPPPPSNLIFNNFPVVGDCIHSHTANSYQKLPKSNGAACSSVLLLYLPTWFFFFFNINMSPQDAAICSYLSCLQTSAFSGCFIKTQPSTEQVDFQNQEATLLTKSLFSYPFWNSFLRIKLAVHIIRQLLWGPFVCTWLRELFTYPDSMKN